MGLADVKPLPSRERLAELFRYDFESGALTWRKRQGSVVAGQQAGTINSGGYRSVRVDRVFYSAHRLIWKLVTGRDPEGLIDHIDGDCDHNAWANLREASRSQNRANAKLNSDNTSGFKGVRYCPLHRKYRALVTFNKRTHHVGYFGTAAEAAEARAVAADKIQGEFARAA